MKRRLFLALVVLLGIFALPLRCPAPLVYRPGEGWTYEAVGESKWTKARAKDQYEVAQQAFDAGKYRLALKAARRTVSRWPLSDSAPKAQYLVGRSYEAKGWDERAFKEYQRLVEKYPKAENYSEILQRQFAIAQRFLGGQWFKLWGVIPFFPSMDKTADMLAKIVRNGPFSPVGPQAQMSIGSAREKQKDYVLAVRAYEKAADVYSEDRKIAAEATFRAAQAWTKQAKTAEYDQSAAGQAIATFGDFMTLYPEDPRGTNAQKVIASLRTEQSRGAFELAQYYERKRRWRAAEIYYNDSVSKDRDSPYAADSLKRLEVLRRRITRSQPAPKPEPGTPAPVPASNRPDALPQ